MKIQELVQNSPDWIAYRASHYNASDAPAMLGCSPHKTRAELLREMHTGVVPEVDICTQKRFDAGHRLESLARPLAEEFIGAELYPVTCSEGRLSASFDGLRLDETEGFEHKQLNAILKSAFAAIGDLPCNDHAATCRLLPIYHRVQMEQQLLVSCAERILFMASDWTADDDLIEEHHCWYYPDAELRAQIVAGWDQFAKDLAAYSLPEPEQGRPTGKAPETLPALRIEVTGMVTASNLAEFKQTALAAIRSVKRELSTDVDFADAERAVKWCSEVESRLAAAKDHALSQTSSIDALFKTIDDISAEARAVRLELDKLVKHRKESIRGEIVSDAADVFAKHVRELNSSISRGALPQITADFAGVIKGKRTVASLRDAVDTELARVKIEANAVFQRMSVNERTLGEHPDHAFLFPDWSALRLKAPDDLAAMITSRVAQHKAKEAARIEAERERIRVEEQAKAQQEAAAQAAIERTRAEAAARAATVADHPVIASPAVAVVVPAIVQLVKPLPVTADPADPATLNLGTICARLGITMTSAFVSDILGVKHSATEKAAKLYRKSDWKIICTALHNHIGYMLNKFEV